MWLDHGDTFEDRVGLHDESGCCLGCDVSGNAPHPAEIVNRTFYATSPHEYFRRRLLLLLTVADRRADLAHMWARGVSYGDVRKEYQAVDEASDVREARRFVVAESQVLAHHVFETFLRLFLAHVGHPLCPPMEVATLLSFADFKRKVKARFMPLDKTDPLLVQQIAEIILGSDGVGLSSTAQARYQRDAAEIEKFLRRFASIYLNDAHLYNAAKHGFIVAAGEHGFSISEDGQTARFDLPVSVVARAGGKSGTASGDGASTEHQGPAVAYLTREPEGQRWSLEVQWLEIERSLLYCCLAVDWLGQLWQVARARRLNESCSPQPFLNLTFRGVEDAFSHGTYVARIGVADQPRPKKGR
jgi:hypothetical protein